MSVGVKRVWGDYTALFSKEIFRFHFHLATDETEIKFMTDGVLMKEVEKVLTEWCRVNVH